MSILHLWRPACFTTCHQRSNDTLGTPLSRTPKGYGPTRSRLRPAKRVAGRARDCCGTWVSAPRGLLLVTARWKRPDEHIGCARFVGLVGDHRPVWREPWAGLDRGRRQKRSLLVGCLQRMKIDVAAAAFAREIRGTLVPPLPVLGSMFPGRRKERSDHPSRALSSVG